MSETAVRPLRVLVSDDQPDVLEAMRLLLKGAGYQAATVDSPAALLSAVEREPYDVILMDMNYARDTTSGEEGLDLLNKLLAREDAAPVIVMTAWSSVDLAVEAMRRGAADFIQKPWDNAKVLGTLEKQAREAAQRLAVTRTARTELEIAHHVQQRLLPQKSKPMRTLAYGGRCLPAREVGGDYYDYLDLGSGRLGVVLADVSGKGVAGALLMANLEASFRSRSALGFRDVPTLLAAVHKVFHESTPTEFYATLFFADYNDDTRELRYVNCGHPAPVLVRAEGSVERLEASATPLGIFGDWNCQESGLTLAPGDTLVLFSDGVIEAGVEDGEEFGDARLLKLLAARRGDGVEDLLDGIVSSVLQFSVDHQDDDITVVALRAV